MSKKRYVIVASSYDKRGRLIYSCTNSYNDSSSLQRFYSLKAGHPKRVYNHAELRCIEVSVLKMKQKVDKLVVIRYDRNGGFKDAHPCEVCTLCIKDFEIKTVMYSTESGMKQL